MTFDLDPEDLVSAQPGTQLEKEANGIRSTLCESMDNSNKLARMDNSNKLETLSHPLWRVPMSEGWERRREKFGPELEMSTILHLVCPSRLLSALIERQQWDHLPLGFW